MNLINRNLITVCQRERERELNDVYYYPDNNNDKMHGIRIHHEFEGEIGKSIPMITVWHHESCRVMTNGDPKERIFHVHRIRISEILPWDRKSYLTHAILPKLSCESYTHWLYWNSRTWSSSDVIVMLK